jgi:hypothetical protein
MLNLEGRRMLKDRIINGEMETYNGVIPPEIDSMISSITEGPGETEKALRQAIFQSGEVSLGASEIDINIPQSLRHYIDTVSLDAAKVTDQDIEELKLAGWTEASIFEVTVTIAAAAGYGRLKIGWESLKEANRVLNSKSTEEAQ